MTQEEKKLPEGLKEAAENYIAPIENDEGLEYIKFNGRDIKDAFIVGAEWQKGQSEMSKINYEGARAVYDDTVRHLQEKIDEKYELGKKDMKEQMMKDAVEGEVVQDLKGRFHVKTNAVSDILYQFGDKVKVIILPKK